MMIDAWTCHVCGEQKPDKLIGVATAAHRSFSGISNNFAVNVRFCLDKPQCFKAARVKAFNDCTELLKNLKSFYPEGKIYEENTLQNRPK